MSVFSCRYCNFNQNFDIVIIVEEYSSMSFSWKCPFHVFVAGFTTSSAIITTSILLYHYASRKSTSKRQSRLPDDYIESIYDKAFELATQLALKAGSNITEAISNKGKAVISVKGSTGVDFVTETDKENERMIFHELRKIFPDHVLIGEESSFLHESIPELTDEPTWIVDPIDGNDIPHIMSHVTYSLS